MPTATPDEPDGTGKVSKSRLDRELEEILTSSKADELPIELDSRRPIQLPYHRSSKHRQWSGLMSPERRGALFVVAALVFAMLAVLVADTSQFLANLLVIAAVISFAYPIVSRVRTSGSGSRSSMPPPSRTWRGRELDIAPPGSSPIDSARDWWNRRQRR